MLSDKTQLQAHRDNSAFVLVAIVAAAWLFPLAAAITLATAAVLVIAAAFLWKWAIDKAAELEQLDE